MTMEMAQPDKRPKAAKFVIGKRHLIVLMATMAPLVCYIARQNLSMAIVAMIEDQKESISSSAASNATRSYFDPSYECPKPLMRDEHGKQVSAMDALRYGPRYRWTSKQKSYVLGAFYATYFAGQVPGARFAELIGAKWALILATVGSSLFSALTPLASATDVYALAFLRALMGICQAALFPALYVLYSRWLPPLERAQALSVIGVGTYVGTMVANTSAGYFIEQRKYGWEYAFYMASVVCALWSAIWVYVGASEPTLDRHIKQHELEYIESKMEVTGKRKKQISWKKVFSSKAVWAFMVANFASEWPFTTVLVLLPTYLNDILHITPLINGMIISALSITYCLTSPVVGIVSAYMVAKRSCGMSVLTIRKVFEGTALYGSALCFLFLPIIGCQTKIVVGALFLQIVMFSFVNGGEVQLPSEMSVDFTGTIYAVGNCAATTTGFIVPLLQGWIVTNSHDRHQWEWFFYLTAIVVTFFSVLFTIYAGNNPKDYSAIDPKEAQKDGTRQANKGEIMTEV